MTKARLTVAVCGALLWASGAFAMPTPQQQCDYARISAWKVYASCIESVVAKDAKGLFAIEQFTFPSFAVCRHTYFKKWDGLQTRPGLLGSTCIGARFVDNSDGTVSDRLTGLVWEKKTARDSAVNYSDPHDADNGYSWGDTFENGTLFTDFLAKINGGTGFAGANGWRLPTLAELQTVLLDFPCALSCACAAYPCVASALDAANTFPSYTWTSTTLVQDPTNAWIVSFNGASMGTDKKSFFDSYVRAVRGGF